MSYIGSKPANKAVVASDLDPAVITGQTALATSPADTDEFLISDAGVLKRLDASLIGGGGKILQVVTASESASRSITSTSYVNSSNGLSVNITPSATSSKILITISLGYYTCPGGQNMSVTIFRDSTNLAGGNGGVGLAYNGGFGEAIPCNASVIDSPSSTSQLTYQVYAKVTGGTGEYGNTNTTATITAFEIGA